MALPISIEIGLRCNKRAYAARTCSLADAKAREDDAESRVERQLGYKQAKYVQRIQIVDSFTNIAGGQGGYWEDRGYEWYAGI